MLSTARRPRFRRLLSLLGTLLILGGLLPVAAASPVLAFSPNVVISEVYGGGGNTGAPYTHDYIELYNRGSSPVSLGGNSVQYTSAAGTANFGSASTLLTELPAFTLNPGQYFLIQESTNGPIGVALPTPDLIDGSAIAMAAVAGKVVYVTGVTPLGCNGGSTPCSADQLARIVDLVGYGGTANFYEGSGPTPAPSNTTAAIRDGGGATDTDDNATDFTVAAPDPDNSVVPPEVAPSVSSTNPANGATNVSIASDVSITFSEAVNVTNPWFTISCGTSGAHTAVVTGGPTTFTLNPDADFANSETCTVTVDDQAVSDQDPNDPPDTMAADFIATFETASTPATPDINISEIYGGGGNAGAIFRNDFIELYNTTTSAVPLAGWSVQYASAAGTTWAVTNLTGTIPAGGYYLIQEASGGVNGAPLPAPDATGTINMSGTAGKVALASTTTALAGACPTGTPIVDFVGYGATATCFEGVGPAPSPSNIVSIHRAGGGATDTESNANDFTTGTPTPTPSAADQAPAVASTDPANGATGVSHTANFTITFSEPVNVTGSWFTISCATSGTHTAVATGGPTAFDLNPDTDFVDSESCTITVDDLSVADQDASDPPDNMTADYVFSFTTAGPAVIPTPIHDIQGATHRSPRAGESLTVAGIVTAKRGNGFYMQDPSPDANDATSEAIFVFTSSPPASVNVGDSVSVAGLVTEFRAGGAASTNLTTTEITAPAITVTSTGNPLPAAIVLGTGGRIPPNTVIEDDATGDVETSGVFDPASDGIDFYESLEAMRVQVNNPVVVGPRNSFGEIFVLGDDGANASVRTVRNGIVIRANDFNPERIQFDDAVLLGSTPNASVGDHFTTAAVGVLDYDFGNFEVELTSALTTAPGGITREVTDAAGPSELSVATFNVENLDANEPQSKFDALAAMIVSNLSAPDVIALEEIQDNNGATNDAVTDADLTLNRLRDAIASAGGPTYDWRQINPVDDQDGGEPGGNIRVGFMFRTDRGLAFVDRPGGTPTAPTTVLGSPGSPELSYSPGRVDPANTAWNSSRKPLAGEFTFGGQKFFLIANHFNSKGGDQPLFGHFQPPTRSSEVQRHQQAQIVNDFVDSILALDAKAKIIVLGDINDFEFSTTMTILKGNVLHDLMDSLPQAERYSYVFEGNSQVLDHIVISDDLFSNTPFEFDPVHANAEFFDQISDHDPSVARFVVATPGTVTVNKTGHGGAALGGAGFTLYVDAAPTGGTRGAEDTTAAGTCTTSDNGTCSITSVPLGTYWLVETTTPNGYATVDPTQVIVGVGPSPGVGDTDIVNLSDQAVPGTVTINKTGYGGAALANAGFTLFVDANPTGGTRGGEDDEAAGNCTTNGAGTCSILNVPLGQYWLVETTTPAGYATINPIAVTVGLGPSTGVGDTDTFNLTDQPVPGTVTINKTGQGGAALSGAGFTLYVDATPTGGARGVEDVTAAGGCTTNSAGTCSIMNVALGEYWLVETTTPNGYATASPIPVTVGLGPSAGVGDTRTINVADQPVPGTVVVNKTGQGRAKTVGITFTVYVDAAPVGGRRGSEDTTSAGSCVTAVVGSRVTCSITGVPLGRYWLVETVPAGNAPVDPIAVTVNLGPAPNTGDTDTFSVKNKPKGPRD